MSSFELPRPTKVDNKNLAFVQITAEQILSESTEILDAYIFQPPKQEITDHTVLRYNELIEHARAIYEGSVQSHPNEVGDWIRYAKFEMMNEEVERARKVYERAVEKVDLADYDEETKQLFEAFADFEEHCNETERAKCIRKFMHGDHMQKGRGQTVLQEDA